MTAVAERASDQSAVLPAVRSRDSRLATLIPTAAAIVNAIAFMIVRPNVGDLQAALSRQSAVAHGVGLTYWFQWFGGGTTPGHYSVLSPYLSALIGALLASALATVAITPLASRALLDTRYRTLGVWAATITAGFNLWSGRVPFALGCAAGVAAIIAVRERRLVRTLLFTGLAVLFSPVSGAFVALGLAGALIVERGYQRVVLAAGLACGVCLVIIAATFGTPGPQGYSVISALITSGTLLAFLLAKPTANLRVVIIAAAVISPLLTLFPNGMGSNFPRLPWICLPAAIIATATTRRAIAVLAIAPAVICCAQATVADIVRSHQPTAHVAYYTSLANELDSLPGLPNYRLEVVQDGSTHTAANVLLDHAALARGYETQEDNELNAVLLSKTTLNPVSYKVWLDNNAVGYVALSTQLKHASPESALVATEKLSYLTRVWVDSKWVLYQVQNADTIVAAPEQLISATQSQLTVRVPCACTFKVRVRYSRFLGASVHDTDTVAKIADDGSGWVLVTTPEPGMYVFQGTLTGLFR
jgi:hypothetical protein